MDIYDGLIEAIARRMASKKRPDFHVTFADLVCIVKDAKEVQKEYAGNEDEDTLEYPGAPTE